MRTCLSTARHGTALALGTVALGLLATAPRVEGAPPLLPPAVFWTRGDGAMTVRGPHCCGDTRFSGHFVALYEVDSAGTATLGRLEVQLDDLDVVVRGGFLDLFSSLMRLRCPSLASTSTAVGRFDGTEILEFAPGTVNLSGYSAEERLSADACADPTVHWQATNDQPVKFVHDPRGNRFGLDAVFHATAEGASYEMTLRLDGTFLNRPPVAAAALITPSLPQGACPARWWWNGQQWELLAEANDPSGLVAAPYSMSGDPDGSWRHGDVSNERWFLSAGEGGPRTFLGEGPLLPSRTFGWGVDYRLEVLARDPFGASAASTCRFRVIDSTPPVVTAPPPLAIGCSQPGGASSSTSPALRTFLAGARATDVVDRAPALLPPLAAGVTVTDTTLFRLGATPVTFRFRDGSGNMGTAPSTVTVRDTVPPTVSLTLVPGAFPPTLTYQRVAATLTTSDDCGGTVTLRLVSITSNAPAFDAHDIVDATLGADDRVFYLFARLAAPGVARLYKVVYEGKDASGNSRMVSGFVVVS